VESGKKRKVSGTILAGAFTVPAAMGAVQQNAVSANILTDTIFPSVKNFFFPSNYSIAESFAKRVLPSIGVTLLVVAAVVVAQWWWAKNKKKPEGSIGTSEEKIDNGAQMKKNESNKIDNEEFQELKRAIINYQLDFTKINIHNIFDEHHTGFSDRSTGNLKFKLKIKLKASEARTLFTFKEKNGNYVSALTNEDINKNKDEPGLVEVWILGFCKDGRIAFSLNEEDKSPFISQKPVNVNFINMLMIEKTKELLRQGRKLTNPVFFKKCDSSSKDKYESSFLEIKTGPDFLYFVNSGDFKKDKKMMEEKAKDYKGEMEEIIEEEDEYNNSINEEDDNNIINDSVNIDNDDNNNNNYEEAIVPPETNLENLHEFLEKNKSFFNETLCHKPLNFSVKSLKEELLELISGSGLEDIKEEEMNLQILEITKDSIKLLGTSEMGEEIGEYTLKFDSYEKAKQLLDFFNIWFELFEVNIRLRIGEENGVFWCVFGSEEEENAGFGSDLYEISGSLDVKHAMQERKESIKSTILKNFLEFLEKNKNYFKEDVQVDMEVNDFKYYFKDLIVDSDLENIQDDSDLKNIQDNKVIRSKILEIAEGSLTLSVTTGKCKGDDFNFVADGEPKKYTLKIDSYEKASELLDFFNAYFHVSNKSLWFSTSKNGCFYCYFGSETDFNNGVPHGKYYMDGDLDLTLGDQYNKGYDNDHHNFEGEDNIQDYEENYE